MYEIAVDFLAGPDASSKLIGWFGGGGWSHAASVLSDQRYLDARNDTLGGVPPGVRIRLSETEKWTRKRRASLQVSLTDYLAWEGCLTDKITTKYDKDAILGFLEGRSMHTAGMWICSALALNAIQHMGRAWTGPSMAVAGLRRAGFVPFPLSQAAHRISPNTLLMMLETAGFTLGPIETK